MHRDGRASDSRSAARSTPSAFAPGLVERPRPGDHPHAEAPGRAATTSRPIEPSPGHAQRPAEEPLRLGEALLVPLAGPEQRPRCPGCAGRAPRGARWPARRRRWSSGPGSWRRRRPRRDAAATSMVFTPAPARTTSESARRRGEDLGRHLLAPDHEDAGLAGRRRAGPRRTRSAGDRPRARGPGNRPAAPSGKRVGDEDAHAARVARLPGARKGPEGAGMTRGVAPCSWTPRTLSVSWPALPRASDPDDRPPADPEDPRRQPRRDRGPGHPHLPGDGHPRRWRSSPRPTAARSTSGWPTRRSTSARAPARDSYLVPERILEAAAPHRRRRHPPRVRVPLRASRLQPGLPTRPGSSSSARRPRRWRPWARRPAPARACRPPACRWCRAATAPIADEAEAARRGARAIGFPVMLKAAAAAAARG